MKGRDILLGAAAGFGAGYVTARIFDSAGALRAAHDVRPRDPARYGALRRRLTVTDIVRSVAAAASLAYGPLGLQLERSVRRLPVWLRPAAFVAEVALLDLFAELPVNFAEGYAVERRYGLTEQSPSSWLTDQAKQGAIALAVASVLGGGLAAALRAFPRTWPYIASGALFPLLLFANVAVPLYVLPLFNTYTPLTGPLEKRLRALAARYGVADAEILRVNMSKQTKKANAFVIGIGNTHRIIVGDTLVEHFPEDEIEFVVAHELGHYVSKDTWRMIALSQILGTIVLFGAHVLDGAGTEEDHTRKLTRVQLWATLVSQALRPAACAFARSREWAADRFALQATSAPGSGASAFKRLRDQNLAEDEQPLWFEMLFSTHPSLRARIAALEQSCHPERRAVVRPGSP